MISILNWNIRGMKSHASTARLKFLIDDHKVSLAAIQEHFIKETNIVMYLKCLGMKIVLQTVVTRSGSFGNKNSIVQSMIVRTKSQLVSFKVRNVLSFSPLFMLNRSPLVGKISGCV